MKKALWLIIPFLTLSVWAGDNQPAIEIVAAVGGFTVPANDGRPAASLDLADPTWLFQGSGRHALLR